MLALSDAYWAQDDRLAEFFKPDSTVLVSRANILKRLNPHTLDAPRDERFNGRCKPRGIVINKEQRGLEQPLIAALEEAASAHIALAPTPGSMSRTRASFFLTAASAAPNAAEAAAATVESCSDDEKDASRP